MIKSKSQSFRQYLKQEHGRAYVILQSVHDIEEYRADVLWGCLHGFAYDAQCEGSRASFLYRLVSLFPNKETGSINSGLSALFSEMVSMLKKVDPTKVSFFVLVFRTSNGTDFKAIAFRSGDKLDEDLEKQLIDVYEYVGEDRWIELYNCIDPKCDTTIERVDDRYDVNFSMSYQSLDPEIHAALTMHGVYAIQYCKWKRLKYVVTYLPYAIEKECGDLIQSWTFDKYGFARPVIAPHFMSLFIKKLNEIIIPAPPGYH